MFSICLCPNCSLTIRMLFVFLNRFVANQWRKSYNLIVFSVGSCSLSAKVLRVILNILL